jgi:PPP family 3-phenylpropionic acid transporter
MLLGMAVDDHGPAIVPAALFAVYLALWVSSLTVSDPAPQPHSEEQPSILSIIRKPAVMAFFVACFLLQAGHAVYYSFYSIYMEDQGYSKTLIGQYWSIGVLAEVAAFWFMHRLLQRIGARWVLIASLLIAALRWQLIGWFPGSLEVLFLAQLLHAFTFGTFHAAAIDLIHRYFVGRHQGRGQALYAGASFGAGGAIGSLAGGYLWESLGPQATFEIAALVSLVAAFIVWRYR